MAFTDPFRRVTDFLSPTRNRTPFGNLWTRQSPNAYPWRQSHYNRGGGLNVGGAVRGMADSALAGMRTATPTAPVATSDATSSSWATDTPAAGFDGVGDMSGQAWEIVRAAIAQQKAANDAAKAAAMQNYLNMKGQYETASSTDQRQMQEYQGDNRARLNNLMAARGTGAGEGAAMNFGRFDQAAENELNDVIAKYSALINSASGDANTRAAALDEQNRLLDTGAPAQALQVQQALEAQAMDNAYKSAQIGQMGGESSGGLTTEEQNAMWSDIGAGVVDGLTLDQIDLMYGQYLGGSIRDLAAAGDPNAQRVLAAAGRKVTPEFIKRGGHYGSARTTSRTPTNLANTRGYNSPFDAASSLAKSMYSTPFTGSRLTGGNSRMPGWADAFRSSFGWMFGIPQYRYGRSFFTGDDV